MAIGDVRYKNGKIMGVVVAELGTGEVVAIIDETLLPELNDEWDDGRVVANVQELEEFSTPPQQYQAILEYNQNLRDRVTSLPGPVAGLHWFNDRLYAVASALRVELGSGHGYMPNDEIEGSPVLAVDSTTVTVGGVGIPAEGVASETATLFQSRSEQQALDELGDVSQHGWDFIHQGWSVPFENGISLYGRLIALNLNRQGVGTQGPTSIAGDNGRPLLVTQKVAVTNAPPQANGWKSTDSPTVYSINASDVRTIDGTYLYADAHIAWVEGSNDISTPAFDGTVAVEYPANNTINVVVDP